MHYLLGRQGKRFLNFLYWYSVPFPNKDTDVIKHPAQVLDRFYAIIFPTSFSNTKLFLYLHCCCNLKNYKKDIAGVFCHCTTNPWTMYKLDIELSFSLIVTENNPSKSAFWKLLHTTSAPCI